MRDTQDAAGAQKLVAVGRVVKPHGIRGELCVEYQANSSELLAKGRTVWLRLPDKTNQPRSITGSRPHQGRWLVTLQGTADRDQAETLRGAEVLVPAGDLPALDENEVYLHEMVGYAVVLENGDPVGVLEGYMDAPRSGYLDHPLRRGQRDFASGNRRDRAGYRHENPHHHHRPARGALGALPLSGHAFHRPHPFS